MRPVKSLLVFTATCFGLVGTANAIPAPGIEAAETLCQKVGFSSQVVQCMQTVNAAKTFSIPAVKVCEELGFASQQVACLEIIKDREYSDTAVATCKGLSFASKITECLKTAGRIPAPAPALQADLRNYDDQPRGGRKLRKEVRRALNALERGDYSDAQIILKDLLIRTDEG